MPDEVTRRAVLGGAIAAAAGAVLLRDASPVPAATAAYAAASTQPAPGGVTLSRRLFPRGTTMQAALRDWQNATGCRPMATKVYFGHRHFPLNADNEKIRAAIALGMTVVLCYQPARRPFLKADAAALERSLGAIKAAGLKKAVVVLWQEPQSWHYRPMLTDEEFIAGSKFYASAARSAGWPVYWNSMGDQRWWASWCPGNAVDGYALDNYSSRQNWRDIWAPGGPAWLADRDGKPFGWFEMGIAAGTSRRPPDSVITSYLTDARNYLASRAPGTTGPVMWYGAVPKNALIPTARFRANSWITRQLYPRLYHVLT